MNILIEVLITFGYFVCFFLMSGLSLYFIRQYEAPQIGLTILVISILLFVFVVKVSVLAILGGSFGFAIALTFDNKSIGIITKLLKR